MPQVLNYFRAEPVALGPAVKHRAIGFGAGAFVGAWGAMVVASVIFAGSPSGIASVRPLWAFLISIVSARAFATAIRYRAAGRLGAVVRMRSWSWAALAGILEGGVVAPLSLLMGAVLTPLGLVAGWAFIAITVLALLTTGALWAFLMVRAGSGVEVEP